MQASGSLRSGSGEPAAVGGAGSRELGICQEDPNAAVAERDEDFFPPRPHPHDYEREIKTAWKKTVAGSSGDIVIPASFFEVKFGQGREIRLSFGVHKTLPSQDASAEDSDQIVFSSKADKLFPVDPENPASLQEIVLGESSTP